MRKVLFSQVHALIDALGTSTPRLVKPKAMGQAKENDGDDTGSDNEQNQLSLQMSNALRTVNDLWQRNSTAWTVDRENMVNSKLDLSHMKKSAFQRRRKQSSKEPESEQCAAYIHLTKTNVTTWWRKVRNSETPPTPKGTPREQEADRTQSLSFIRHSRSWQKLVFDFDAGLL